jgi:hypothetical protein
LKKKETTIAIVVLRNVFPVEWGIFAFSSIIIVTKYFAENALKADSALGRDDCRPYRPPLLEPWRVEVALLVEGAPRH